LLVAIEGFLGNEATASTLTQMAASGRIPQTILLSGPEGIGKATLARKFAGLLVGDANRIELDDLSLPGNRALIADREKWTSEKRLEDPLLFASHPDFVTFPPDGPLRQISMQQMRVLKERAKYKPLHGSRRVFLIDGIDRANEQAANSLLKTLEEPPDHMVIVMTAENAYDLLPTIRSRAVMLQLTRLSREEMETFAKTRDLSDPARRVSLAGGSPGIAVALDLEAYDKRRTAMLTLLEVASKRAPFAKWLKFSESIGASKSDKLEFHLKVLYGLLEDALLLQNGMPEIRNEDIRKQLTELAEKTHFDWIRAAVKKVDSIMEMLRRNIQKSIALDSLIYELQEV
jgi:DNA polymerase-3 subunit delta'